MLNSQRFDASFNVPAGDAQELAHREALAPQLLRQLLEVTGLAFDAPILDVNPDRSFFLSALLARGYANLIATHRSAALLHEVRHYLPPEQASRVLWVVDDVTRPMHLFQLDPVLLWHDEHLLHDLTAPDQREAYRRLLRHMVSVGGWVLLGLGTDSNRPGAEDLRLESAADLSVFLGHRYTLRHVFEEGDAWPTSAYALFQRNDTTQRGQWVSS